MSGRVLIAILLVSSIFMGYFFYQSLQRSSSYKHLVTDQMAVEYSDYTRTFQKIDRLLVGETTAGQFFAPLTPVWKFELHDKTLVAFVPSLTSNPEGQMPSPEVLTAAKETIQKSLSTWLEDKFHTRKDLLVKVHLQDEVKAP